MKKIIVYIFKFILMPLPTEVVNLTTTVQYNEFARNNFSSEYTIRRQIYILKKTNFDINSFDTVCELFD